MRGPGLVSPQLETQGLDQHKGHAWQSWGPLPSPPLVSALVREEGFPGRRPKSSYLALALEVWGGSLARPPVGATLGHLQRGLPVATGSPYSLPGATEGNSLSSLQATEHVPEEDTRVRDSPGGKEDPQKSWRSLDLVTHWLCPP